MEETKTITEIRNLKQNSISFRLNGVGSDLKLYWEDITDLENQLATLNAKADSIKDNIKAIKEKMKETV